MPTVTTQDVDKYKEAVLRAAAENNVALLRPFLEEANLAWEDIRNAERQHVLHIAAMEGANDVLDLLMRYPKVMRRINSRDRSARSALHLAAAMGFETTVRKLVGAKAALEQTDVKGCTPLHLAVTFEWTAAAKALLELGANPMREDLRGDTANDIAEKRSEYDLLETMSTYSGVKPKNSTWHDLRRKVFGGSNPRAHVVRNGRRGAMDAYGCGNGELGEQARNNNPNYPCPEPKVDCSSPSFHAIPPSNDADIIGSDQICLAIAEAQRGNPDEEDVGVIEWNGLEPILVQPTTPRAMTPRGATTPRGSTTPRGAATPRAASASATTPRGAKSVAALTPRSLLIGATASSKSLVPSGIGIFSMQMFFDEQVKRLEFEVEWSGEEPLVGTVKAGGEADRRGLIRGDRIVELGGKRTLGRGRAELLPALKARPLQLLIHRKAPVATPSTEPHMELRVNLSDAPSVFSKQGIELAWRGQLPVAMKVRPETQAWAVGVLDGDAVVAADGKDLMEVSREEFESAVKVAHALTIWRRPLGSDFSAPWKA